MKGQSYTQNKSALGKSLTLYKKPPLGGWGLLLLLLLIPFFSFAGTIKGVVKDATGSTLPYAIIYIQGTTIGTNANASGNYELSMAPGTYKVICEYIGFNQSSFNISITGNETVQHNFTLQSQGLEMKEVVVHASSEDPAYAIIRHAIDRRTFHLDEIKSFQTSIYLKGVIRTRSGPNKILGTTLKPEDKAVMGMDSAGKGVLFLCEEDADYYALGAKNRTVIHDVRQSGNPNGLGFSRFPSVITFYENNVRVLRDEDSRGFISPISDNALNYYKYKLLGQFQENGHTIYKISVKPKRLYEPCFSGDIYIVDEDWAIHSLNMQLTRLSDLDKLDTLKVEQVFLPLSKGNWVIKSQVIFFAIKVLGFDATADVVTVYNKQKVNEPVPDTIFNNNVVSSYDKDANKKDSAYWKVVRVIPLEKDEKNDYVLKDSIEKWISSPGYIDSMRRKENKVSLFASLFTAGVTYNTKDYKNTFTLNPLLVGIGIDNILNYNVVEGANIAPKIGWAHKIDTGKTLHADVALRYGFSNTHFNAISRLYYKTEDRHWTDRAWIMGVEGGKYVFQYDADNPVLPVFNSAAALLYRQNDLKLYERYDASAYVGRNYGNGLKWFVKFSYQQRIPLDTTTNYSFDHNPKVYFNDNLPAHLSQEVPDWQKHDAALAHASISYQPGYTYTQYPDYKIGSSTAPVFALTYDKGIPNILNSVVNYDKWRFSIKGDVRMKLFGSLSYNIAAGGFLNAAYVSIPDLMHLYGNRGIGYASPYLESFQFAQFYDFSNKEPIYGEVHLEYNLNGLLSNKIPLLRQARWNIVMGTNTFYATQNDYYTEAFIGVDNIGWKIFRILRVDFVQSWDSYGGRNSGIRFGLKLPGVAPGAIRVNQTYSEW